MVFRRDDIDSRLEFFLELLWADEKPYLWSYDAEGSLLQTNCPELVLDKVFQHGNCYRYMMEHVQHDRAPLVMSNPLGMMWGAVTEYEGETLSRIHVLGPVFSQTITNAEIENSLRGSRVSMTWKPHYIEILCQLPVIGTVMFCRRVLSMEYCISERRLMTSDVVLQTEQLDRKAGGSDPADHAVDRMQIYLGEQSMLRLIREGDPNYHSVIQRVTRNYRDQEQLSSNMLQHAKLGQVQFVALCCHAAIEGGLSVESAYNHKDAYVRSIENAQSVSEVMQIGITMYKDYVNLAHKQRSNPAYSKAVQSTCDYIEAHLNEKLTAELLARRVGYSNYYLSRLFKNETGFSIASYTTFARVERAKLMLSTTNDSISEIAEELGFGGRNYFAVIFRKITEIPPAAYREQKRRL